MVALALFVISLLAVESRSLPAEFPSSLFSYFPGKYSFWNRSLEMNDLVERGLDVESVALGEVPALLAYVKLGRFLNLFVFFFVYQIGLLWR